MKYLLIGKFKDQRGKLISLETFLDDTKKLSDDELSEINGSTLYVSVNGGDPIKATPMCSGGRLNLEYSEGGVKKLYDTGIGLGATDLVGTAAYITLLTVDSQNVINFTINISTEE